MKITHYMELRINSLDGGEPSKADAAFAVEKIVGALHHFIVEGGQCALAFPEMKNSAKSEFGKTVHIFGDMENLMKFMTFRAFAALNVSGLFNFIGSPIKDVPAVTEYEQYTRFRKVEKQGAAYQDRVARRAEQRGQVPQKESGIKKDDRKGVFFIKLRSASTGNRSFSLFVKREDADKVVNEAKLSSYGFGVKVPAIAA